MRKKQTKKIFAMLLALVTAVTSVAGTSYYTANAATGPADGQVEYPGGTNSATGHYDIEVSKTIEEVAGKENYFDITLQTTTHRHKVDLSTDVVIVLDISNTMNDDSDGNNDASDSDKKLTYAKNATNTFIRKFATNANLDTNRKIGVVTFNRDAEVVVEMTEANDLNDYVGIESKIDAITAPTGMDVKWTNIQGGLKLAENLLADSTAVYRYVILMTDGFPTTYLVDSNDTSQEALTGYNPVMGGTSGEADDNYDKTKAETANDGEGEEGYFANTRVKAINYGGTSYSNRAAEKAQATAQAMKDSGISIFSVGVALASQNLSTMWSYIIDTTGMEADEAYTIGSTTESYKNWLENEIAGGALLTNSAYKYADAYNQTQLESNFENIMYDIEHAPPTTMREFYTLDPMSEIADFIGFYDKDGNLAANPNELVGVSKENAENTAVFGGSGNENKIHWDMLQSGFTMDGENLVFSLKYRVRLTNEKEDFRWNWSHEMNETTTLNYSQKYQDTGADVPDGTGTLEYPIPKTEGYKGSLKFQKIDGDTKAAIANVAFTLQHYGASCSVCNGDALIADVTVTSDENGYVEFNDIPSGHDYYLIEEEPEEYVPIHNHIVIVSYGDTYIGTKTAENKLVDGKLNGGSGEAFVIENNKVEPVEIQIQASKSLDGNVPEEGAFQFMIQGEAVHGADHYETVTNDANGIAQFSKIVFDKPGTYHFTISEAVGTDTGVIYDSTAHTVEVVVSEIAAETAYQAVVTVDGGTPVTYIGKDNTVETVSAGAFTNTSRGEGTAELQAKKIYTDGQLAADDFSFQIRALTENAPMPANKVAGNDADGSVSFGEIVYTTPGVYEYEISEVNMGDKSLVYDGTKYKAIVTVTAPADLTSADALTATVEYVNISNNTKTELPVFNNKDRVLPTIAMKGYKSLNGKAAADQAFTFVFQEVDIDGNAIGTSVEIQNGKNGVVDFDAVLQSAVDQMVEEVNAGESEPHFYKIYEKPGSDAKITYDDVYYVLRLDAFATVGFDYYQLTALMQKVDGNQVENVFSREKGSNIRIEDSNAGALVNFANTSKVTLDLSATKVLQSDRKTLKAGDYTFVLANTEGTQQTVTNDANGNVQFETLEFTAADVGTHSYVIYEVEGDDTKLFYDDSRYTVTVEVSVDEYGNLNISEPTIIDEHKESFTAMEFVNKDIDPTHLHLRVKKTVNGAVPTVAQQFEFQLINADTNAVIETRHNVGEMVAFSDIALDEEGTYNYIIKEVLPEVDEDKQKAGIQYNGFTYDETEHKIQVIVTDSDNDGVLEKKVTVNGKEDPAANNTVDAGTFDNSYEAKDVSVVLEGNKKLTGRNLASGEFSFVLTAVSANAPMPVNDNVGENDGAGNFKFDKITFTEPGIYEYEVKEAVPEDAVNNVKDGITYDTTVYNVKITVTDNGKGQLVAETLVNGSADAAIAFENRYTFLPTAIRLTADKTLSGRTLQNREFSFRLIEVDSSNQEIKETEQIVTNGITTGNDVSKIYFDGIIYNAVGTHTYKISEVVPEDGEQLGGVVYDDVVYTVIVKVTDNGKGQLVATVDGKSVSEYNVGEFTNRYESKPVSVNPEVTKALTGRDWKDGDSFSFTLEPSGTATTDAVRAGIVTFENKKVTIDSEDADKKAVFGNITFNKAGTYYFVIAEEQGSLDNMTYDSHTALLRVIVTDNGKGELVADTYYRDSVVFNNKYIPDAIDISFKGTKTLEGRDLKANEFSFMLKDADGNERQTVQNLADGTFSFDALSFDKAGTYYYTVSEVAGNLAGVTYDQKVYDITVTVTYDSATGLLDAAVSYKTGNTAADKIEFTNDYIPSGKDVSITANKVVTPSEGNSFVMKEGQFQFAITPAETNPASDPVERKIVTNDADGNVNFGHVTYTEPGTYIYTVNEIDTGLGGIIYDDTVYRVTVVVTDNTEEAKLDAEVTVEKVNDSRVEKAVSLTFNNGYDPKAATAIIHGHKVLESEHKILEAGAFTFTLEAVTADAPMPEGTKDGVATVTNTAAGVYQFGVITYEETGIYKYVIREVVPENDDDPVKAGIQKDGYTYDDQAIEVTVEVVDIDGVLSATVKNVVGTDELENKFINEYEPEPTDLTIEGSKELTGRELEAGEFSFVLKDANGNEIQTVQNLANGTFSFDKLVYDKAGTYYYTVSEVKGSLGGITYDTTIYDVNVVVTDDQGQLSAVKSVKAGGTTANAIAFENSYDTTPASVTLTGNKKLTGRGLKAEEFSFVLKGADGKEIQTVKNAVNGAFSFDKLSYDTPGTYEYTVSEVKENLGGVVYDTAIYAVKVVVTDNGEGKLLAATTITKNETEVSAIEFANEYKTEPIDLTLQIEKDFQTPAGRGWLESDVFHFELAGFDNNAIDALNESEEAKTEVSIGADKKSADFGKIVLDKAGTYRFEIREKAGNIQGVTYDDTIYKVRVDVEDDGKGNLNIVQTRINGTEVDILNNNTLKVGTFVNTYDPGTVGAVLRGTKYLTGRDLNAGEFKFGIKAINAGSPLPASLETSNDAQGNIEFGEIKFKEPGEYKYLIFEKDGNLGGVTYSKEDVTATVKVDYVNGILEVTEVSYDHGDEKGFAFYNDYDPDPVPLIGRANLKVTKVLQGRGWLDSDEFIFTLKAADEATKAAVERYDANAKDPQGIKLPETTLRVTKANKDASYFGDIIFHEEGTFTFEITETKGSLAGVTYDTHAETVVVTVTDKGNGKLEAEVTSTDVDYTFTNTYKTGETSAEIAGKKILNGRPLKENEFTFTISAVTENAPMPEKTTVGHAADGSFTFGKINYTAAGTYEYEVTEVIPEEKLPGVEYDPSVYRVKVIVTDDPATAKLTAKVEITKDEAAVNAITFENDYNPDNVTLEGKTNLKVNKTFTGRAGDQWLDSDVFEFRLSADAETQKVVGTKVILPEELTLKVTKANKDTAHFGDITFKEAGTYTFLITEVNSGAGGITYDGHTMTVTVNVTDDQNGKLIAAAPVIEGAEFKNSYAVTQTTATLSGKKVLTGRDLAADEFSFVIKAITENAPMPANTTVKNAEDGTVTFAPITFTKAGEYRYEISETKGSLAGVTYDEGKVEAIVKVVDNHDGTLTASVSYKKNGTDVGGSFEFKNSYAATSVKVVLTGEKKVVDESGAYVLRPGDFTFEITPADSNPDSDPYKAGTVTNTVVEVAGKKVGRFEFTPSGNYTEAGTYVYNIKEVSKGASGIVYDSSVYEVTVTVTDIGGKLEAKTSVKKDGKSVEGTITFTNKYEPTLVTTVIDGKKVLEGRNLEGNDFEFKLEAANDLALKVLPQAKLVKNDQAGVFQFDSLSFKEVGTYLFKVTEVKGSLGGVTYDPSEYIVEVVVTGENIQTETPAPPTDEDQTPVPPTGEEVTPPTDEEVTPPADEEVTPPADEEVTPPADEEVTPPADEEVTPSADEEVTPPANEEVTPQADEEVTPPADEEVTPPAEETTLLDVVSKVNPLRFLMLGTNGGTEESQPTEETANTNTGKLYAKVTIKKDGVEVSEIVFNNKYTPEKVKIGKDTQIPVKGTKVLTGRALKNGEFQFEIIANDADSPMPENNTVTNDANGNFEFGQITFDKEGTYYYTIIEKSNGIAGIEYDKVSYTVKVVVTDDGKGKLHAAVTYYDSEGKEKAVVFNNKYKAAPTGLYLTVVKELTGRTLKAGEFEFEITAVTKGAPLPAVTRVKNDAKGIVVFGEIKFTEAGDYTYRIREIKGNLKDVTYDDTVYEVTVHVTDDLKGQLRAVLDKDFQGIKFVNKYKNPEKPKNPEDPDKPEPTPTPDPKPTPDVSPMTGDLNNPILWIAVAIVAATGGMYVFKRKK